MNKEEILKAVNIIKEVCLEQKSNCMDCPFFSKDGCYITSNYPDHWEIKEKDDNWRAFYG